MLLIPPAKKQHFNPYFMVQIGAIIFFCHLLSGCSPLIIAGTAAGAGAMIATDRRSTENFFSDEGIEIQATDAIYANKKFGKKINVSVISFNGTVLLVGETPNKESKQAIINRVNKIEGIIKVVDAIEVKELASTIDRSNDAWITSKVKSHIIVQKGPLTRTKVVTSGSNVYLMGIVSNQEAKQILTIVKSVNGIKTVTPLFDSLDGSLEKTFSASTYIKPGIQETTKSQVAVKSSLEDEDDITVQPYVLQPPIRIDSNE